MRRNRYPNYGTFSNPISQQAAIKPPQGIKPTAELIAEIETLQFKKNHIDCLTMQLENYARQIATLNTKIEAIDTHLRSIIILPAPTTPTTPTNSLANPPESLLILNLQKQKVEFLKKREELLDGLRYKKLTTELEKAKIAYTAQEKKCDALYQKIQSASAVSDYAPTL